MAETLQHTLRKSSLVVVSSSARHGDANLLAEAADALDAKDAEIARLTAERDEAVNALRRAYQNATKREDTPCAPI